MNAEKRIVPNEILLAAAGELLEEGKDVTLLVKGNSMLPYLHNEEDSICIRKMPSVAVGDIVLAQIAPGHYVVHRIFALDGEAVTLMGDGNIRGTESCTKADILGTVVSFIRPSGRTVIPGKGRIWRAFLPVRRYILFIHRKLKKIL